MASSRFSTAVHVLALLAKAKSENLKSEMIARSVNTNPVVIRRLLCALNCAGLVVSQTGAAGGTRLTRSAEQITLLEVYRAISPREVFALHSQEPSQHCSVGRNIEAVLAELQGEVSRAIEQKLAQFTLQDVIRSVENRQRSCSEEERMKVWLM